MNKVSPSKKAQVGAMLKAIHAQESAEAAKEKAAAVAEAPETMKLGAAARILREESMRRSPITGSQENTTEVFEPITCSNES